ncbi:lysosomal proton-coupled steroid conjugate and bile acid symporter SLC46A3-like [Mytilus galloprovincialis]|uniref:lysosomal proton-coupled steroid conjugate and bile acid symporter SLC46A3-like n=1 Tax=Mytilus galloprovincialis TaxID=29158 RepID=UPI003F7BA7B0
MASNEEKIESLPPLKMTRQHYLLYVMIALFMYSTVCSVVVETQYAYYAVQRERNVTGSVSRDTSCTANKSTSQYLLQQEIQRETAQWNAYGHIASAFPALIMTILVGSWSDKIGRRVALIIPILGLIFKCSFLAISVQLEWNIYYLLIPFFVDGIAGTSVGFISAALSFTADLTKYGKTRTFGIVLVEMTLGLGVTTANITSGYLIRYTGFLYSVVACLSVTILTLILIIFLPETVQSKKNFQSVSQIQYFKNSINFYIHKGPSRWKYIILAASFSLSVMPTIGRNNVQIFYLLNSPYCWSSVLIGWFGAARSVSELIIGLGLVRLLRKCMSERQMLFAGTLSAIGYYTLMSTAVNDIMVFLTPVVGIMSHYPKPMIRSLLSAITARDEQGAMFGGLTAIESTSGLLGSVLANFIYGETVAIYRGIAMAIFGVCHFIALCLISVFIFREKREKKIPEDVNVDDEKIIYAIKM